MENTPAYFNEFLFADKLSLAEWEKKLSLGWDRVGTHFFRKRWDHFQGFNQNLDFISVRLELLPLRFRLDETFEYTKSQRINIRKNKDLKVKYGRAFLDDEKLELFERWYITRFGEMVSIGQWVSGNNSPFPTMECAVYDKDKLVACSFFDETKKSDYSTLAFFEPNEAKRSLGTFTLISEIEFGRNHKKMFHYPGHAHKESSMYDYKKQFCNRERFDWDDQTWKKF
jgi:leucyl-tRNA---protein transferase